MEYPLAVTELHVDGMTCSHCVQGVTKRLEQQGLKDVFVNLATGKVKFSSAQPAALPEIIKSIEQLGYQVNLPAGMGSSASRRSLDISEKFLITLPFTLVLMAHMVSAWHWLHSPYVQLVVSLPVYAIGLSHFARSAWGSLRAREPNMDVLITIGFIAAFVYSLVGTLAALGPEYLFYETGATIITAVLFGNVLERRALKQTTSAISELHAIQNTKAKRLKDGMVEEITAESIVPADVILLSHGDRVPADGEIIGGDVAVDEAMITGESLPVERTVGHKLVGGTLVVKGNCQLRVTAVGQDTVLSHIIRLVESAQSSKPRIQRIGDRVSAVFVPIVVGIALTTFLVSFLFLDVSLSAALMRSVAVLVIACPCAVGLATPTAVLVGVGRAARQGILIKGGATLEEYSEVQTFVFDKTGTLTSGEFEVRDLRCYGQTPDRVRAIIVGLESYSSHPLARSLLRAFAADKALPLERVREIGGLGIEGFDSSGTRYALGSYQLGKDATSDKSHDLYLLEGHKLIATLMIQDALRPGAAEAIANLKKSGASTVLLSGDRADKVANVAAQLGIDKALAQQSPDSKLQEIERLQALNTVAFVGDGINDAPALARAQVGISLSNATQVAVQSAQVVLLEGKLERLWDSYQISRLTMRTIKENLFWAFCYNVLAIPMAAAGYLSPMIAALSMVFSDVIVIGNSLRLRWR